MSKPEREVVVSAQEGVDVAALWYGEPHNCWRYEIRTNIEPLDNMTHEAAALSAALVSVLKQGQP